MKNRDSALSQGLKSKEWALGPALVVLALLAGCPDGEPASAADVARRAGIENPVNERIVEKVTSAVPRAGIETELALLRGALLTHVRMHGTRPASLADMEPSVRIRDPDEYLYDPEKGEIRSRSYPDL